MILNVTGENLTACAKRKEQFSCTVTVEISTFSYYIDRTTPLHPYSIKVFSLWLYSRCMKDLVERATCIMGPFCPHPPPYQAKIKEMFSPFSFL